MTVYQSNRLRKDGALMGLDVGVGGQVLDLETAVKDGILGGGGGIGVGGGCGLISTATTEKLDLKKMIEELEGSIVGLGGFGYLM
ncbi:unnamed protein product [Linum trigynum]|uniref:Uncharacterized protein n=1 Tax=Linum trigynum TaxID=586398 RepID=A0AAV2CZZ8_9ROSI